MPDPDCKSFECWKRSQPDAEHVGEIDFLLHECLPEDVFDEDFRVIRPDGQMHQLDSSKWDRELAARINSRLATRPNVGSWIEAVASPKLFEASGTDGSRLYSRDHFVVARATKPDGTAGASMWVRYGRRECFHTYCHAYQRHDEVAKVRRRWHFRLPHRRERETDEQRRANNKLWRQQFGPAVMELRRRASAAEWERSGLPDDWTRALRDARFFIDEWGNVVAEHARLAPSGGADRSDARSYAFADVDHTFPVSRGGESVVGNMTVIFHVANRFVKRSLIANAFCRVTFPKTAGFAGQPPSDVGEVVDMRCGITVDHLKVISDGLAAHVAPRLTAADRGRLPRALALALKELPVVRVPASGRSPPWRDSTFSAYIEALQRLYPSEWLLALLQPGLSGAGLVLPQPLSRQMSAPAPPLEPTLTRGKTQSASGEGACPPPPPSSHSHSQRPWSAPLIASGAPAPDGALLTKFLHSTSSPDEFVAAQIQLSAEQRAQLAADLASLGGPLPAGSGHRPPKQSAAGHRTPSRPVQPRPYASNATPASSLRSFPISPQPSPLSAPPQALPSAAPLNGRATATVASPAQPSHRYHHVHEAHAASAAAVSASERSARNGGGAPAAFASAGDVAANCPPSSTFAQPQQHSWAAGSQVEHGHGRDMSPVGWGGAYPAANGGGHPSGVGATPHSGNAAWQSAAAHGGGQRSHAHAAATHDDADMEDAAGDDTFQAIVACELAVRTAGVLLHEVLVAAAREDAGYYDVAPLKPLADLRRLRPRVVVCGSRGCGKSTLIDALCRATVGDWQDVLSAGADRATRCPVTISFDPVSGGGRPFAIVARRDGDTSAEDLIDLSDPLLFQRLAAELEAVAGGAGDAVAPTVGEGRSRSLHITFRGLPVQGVEFVDLPGLEGEGGRAPATTCGAEPDDVTRRAIASDDGPGGVSDCVLVVARLSKRSHEAPAVALLQRLLEDRHGKLLPVPAHVCFALCHAPGVTQDSLDDWRRRIERFQGAATAWGVRCAAFAVDAARPSFDERQALRSDPILAGAGWLRGLGCDELLRWLTGPELRGDFRPWVVAAEQRLAEAAAALHKLRDAMYPPGQEYLERRFHVVWTNLSALERSDAQEPPWRATLREMLDAACYAVPMWDPAPQAPLLLDAASPAQATFGVDAAAVRAKVLSVHPGTGANVPGMGDFTRAYYKLRDAIGARVREGFAGAPPPVSHGTDAEAATADGARLAADELEALRAAVCRAITRQVSHGGGPLRRGVEAPRDRLTVAVLEPWLAEADALLWAQCRHAIDSALASAAQRDPHFADAFSEAVAARLRGKLQPTLHVSRAPEGKDALLRSLLESLRHPELAALQVETMLGMWWGHVRARVTEAMRERCGEYAAALVAHLRERLTPALQHQAPGVMAALGESAEHAELRRAVEAAAGAVQAARGVVAGLRPPRVD